MSSNQLIIRLSATPCGGWPRIRTRLDGVQISHVDMQGANDTVVIDFDTQPAEHVIEIERWGKNSRNTKTQDGVVIEDQVLEIQQVYLDGVLVPDYIVRNLSEFRYHDKVDAGSLYFGPNGVWCMTVRTPLLTYFLDQKIQHESQYSQDYQYPWSYRLGPGQAEKLLADIEYVQERVERFL